MVYPLPLACAVPPESAWHGSNTCGAKFVKGEETTQTCCWKEGEVMYCQTCTSRQGGGLYAIYDCKPKVAQMTTPPTTGENVLPGGGLAEQPEQPLFGGQNDAGVPPTGGVEQPPTATTQPTPGGGANVPSEGGSAEQPPTPQDDNQGGGLPPIKNQENAPPGGSVVEQPEDDGQQEDSSEGAETAGPLT